jgi:hypothetical protein
VHLRRKFEEVTGEIHDIDEHCQILYSKRETFLYGWDRQTPLPNNLQYLKLVNPEKQEFSMAKHMAWNMLFLVSQILVVSRASRRFFQLISAIRSS